MKSPHISRGFTLIELLVVISIISLLVAVLLPALGKARFTAKNLICLQNARQISLAVFMYASDYDQDMRGRQLWTMANDIPLSGMIEVDYGIRKTDIYDGCPLRRDNGYADYGNNGGYVYVAPPGSGYDTNRTKYYYLHKPFTQAAEPAKTFLIGEPKTAYARYGHMSDTWGIVVNGWGTRIDPIHERKNANWIFMDGHGKSLNVQNPVVTTYFEPESPLSY